MKPSSPIYRQIYNRGVPPVSFVQELLEWGKSAPDEIFARNNVPVEAYTVIRSKLGLNTLPSVNVHTPSSYWVSLCQRKAAMLELMLVHAGLESSWDFNAGVDTTNKRSLSSLKSAEAGPFQVSFDSALLDSIEGQDIMQKFLASKGIYTPGAFVSQMRDNSWLAFEYYARLVRVSIAWAGPLIRNGKDSVYPYLSRDSMMEFYNNL